MSGVGKAPFRGKWGMWCESQTGALGASTCRGAEAPLPLHPSGQDPGDTQVASQGPAAVSFALGSGSACGPGLSWTLKPQELPHLSAHSACVVLRAQQQVRLLRPCLRLAVSGAALGSAGECG